MTNLSVKLAVFEGPLDLLLHLIEKNKVDIHDIPIVMITDQYMAYIRALESEDMELMSEFLVMAATLLDIKCRMLLPAPQDPDAEEQDPRAELVERLIEYKMYKYMSQELSDRHIDAGRSIFKGTTLPAEIAGYREPIDYAALVGEATIEKLQLIVGAMLRRQADKVDPIRSTFGEVAKDEIDMEQKMAYVEAYLASHRRFAFVTLLERQRSKMEIIVTFLVVLELIRIGRVSIRQNDLDGDIIIMAA